MNSVKHAISKKDFWVNTTILLGVILMLLIGVIIVMAYESRRDGLLLETIRSVRPGNSITELKDKLGSPMKEISDVDKMLIFGTIKDSRFCEGKKLYWFYIQCRALEVYTDQEDRIVFVTWQQL